MTLPTPFKVLALALILCPSLCAKTIIWDLGGVLFTTDRTKITVHELGIGSLLGYIFLDFKNPAKLQRKAFNVLNHFGKQTCAPHLRLKSPHGMELPQLFVDVLTGAVSHQEALKLSLDLIDSLYSVGLISTRRERHLLERIMHTMFDSRLFIKYTKAIHGAPELIHLCAQDPQCTQYVLSNWDATSFELLYGSHDGQKVFKHIMPERILISGACNMAKPDPAIFYHLIESHNLDPKECVFIDDNYENIESAKACGFNTIHFHNMSYRDLQKKLINQGYIFATANNSTKATNYATV